MLLKSSIRREEASLTSLLRSKTNVGPFSLFGCFLFCVVCGFLYFCVGLLGLLWLGSTLALLLECGFLIMVPVCAFTVTATIVTMQQWMNRKNYHLHLVRAGTQAENWKI